MVSDRDLSPIELYLLDSTTNPGQPLAAKWSLSGPRALLRDNLAAKGCPEFFVKFDNYSINVDDPM